MFPVLEGAKLIANVSSDGTTNATGVKGKWPG
jgi:hypothetical protein